MNILIEDAESLAYLTSTNQWTKIAAEGRDFGTTGTAFATAKKEPMGRFNIVAYVEQTTQIINLNHGRGRGVEMVKAEVAVG